MKSKFKNILIATVALITIAAGGTCVFAQKPTGAAPIQTFERGEELIYVGEFSRALLRNVDVADFRFTASRESLPKPQDPNSSSPTNGKPYALKLTSDVSSKGFFSKLFNLRFRQRVESIVEPVSFTVQKTKRVDEQGKRARSSEAVFDRGQVYWIERDPNNPSRAPRTVSNSFTGQIQDVLSAIYYLRTQPLEVGKDFHITISDSGRVYQVPVRVVEKKRMRTVLGRVEVVRVDPQLFGPNQMLPVKGGLSIWLTNDRRHIPVKARIKTEYGTFDITLKKVIQNSSPELLTQSR